MEALFEWSQSWWLWVGAAILTASAGLRTIVVSWKQMRPKFSISLDNKLIANSDRAIQLEWIFEWVECGKATRRSNQIAGSLVWFSREG